MRLQTIHVQQLTADAYRKLYRLNFRDKSPMQIKLSMARKGEIEGHVIICYNRKVLGWTLVWYKRNCDKYTVPIAYFYVRRSARNTGVGSMLLRAANDFCRRRYNSRMGVWAHDGVSADFFEGSGLDLIVYHNA